MSDRTTISVYIDGHIADIGYYGDWYDMDLFFEAIAIAALFHECKTIQEYNEKKYGRQKFFNILEPEAFENTEENLKFLEECSERPILVDLTEKCIYEGYSAWHNQNKFEEYEKNIAVLDSVSVQNIDQIMSHGVISFAQVDWAKILGIFREYKELHNHLSTKVVELLQKEK